MTRRSDLTPGLTGDAYVTVDDVLEHLRLWRLEALERVEALAEYRRRAADAERQLESPRAVYEYIDFFSGFFTRAADDLERILSGLPVGLEQVHLDAMRQLASNAAAEGRRCVGFRDKWINRPLPYEQVRPLLNQLSIDTRDQLADFRELSQAADRLVALAGPPQQKPGDPDAFDRRALFNRMLGRKGEPGEAR